MQVGNESSPEALPKKKKPKPALGIAVASQGWSGEGWTGKPDGFLAFVAGDRIDIMREGEPGSWWLGRLNGMKGWYPSAFCVIEKASNAGEAWRAAAALANPTGGADIFRHAANLAVAVAASPSADIIAPAPDQAGSSVATVAPIVSEVAPSVIASAPSAAAPAPSVAEVEEVPGNSTAAPSAAPQLADLTSIETSREVVEGRRSLARQMTSSITLAACASFACQSEASAEPAEPTAAAYNL